MGFLLQSVLGGSAPLFAAEEIDDWVFKFSVSSKEVGLLVYKLDFFFQCADFKVIFNLWNDQDFQFAKKVIAEAYGTHFPWNHVEYKRSRKSSLDQASHPGYNPLMGANSIPVRQSGMSNRQSPYHQVYQKLAFSHLGPCFASNFSVNPLQESSPCPDSIMAYKFVDPSPFMPRGSHRQMVGYRKQMTRVVLGGLRRRNCDVAIVNIEPLPDQHVSFQSIRDLLDDFLRNRRRFNFVHDRDFLISGSPHEYGNYRISFVERNRDWNNKIITINCEVWLMLLGYNIDFWSRADIEKTVSEFGRLLVWEEDPNNLARIVVKARVVDLSEIPWFIVCSEGEDFEGYSWTVQCEIFQYRVLGGGPGDEDQPLDDVDPNLFDFFSYDQPSNAGPANAEINNNQNANDGHAPQWGLWPDGPEVQADAPFIGSHVNPEGPSAQIEPIPQPEPDPINPRANDFLEINNLVEVFIPQANGHPLHFIQEDINENNLMGHFSPGMTHQQVDIPLLWSDFFTVQLMNPLSFIWAKNFLTSSALQYLQSGEGSVTFSLPDKCPFSKPPDCSVVHMNRKGVEVIRNLGESFCKVDPYKLTSVALSKKKAVAPPGGKKLAKKSSNSINDDDDVSRITKRKSRSGPAEKASLLSI
uniref:DUF4283 domain-containing protein n=1 Tax=Setaria viridis TaxID=4556 RepID=A0A4V6DBQ9_SETVI|nr:hypothetical protein SEVIR_2G330700v2 [Setaria viridis]